MEGYTTVCFITELEIDSIFINDYFNYWILIAIPPSSITLDSLEQLISSLNARLPYATFPPYRVALENFFVTFGLENLTIWMRTYAPSPHFHWLLHWFHVISRVSFFSGKNVELLEVSLKETLKVIRSQAMNAFIHQGHCPPCLQPFSISKFPQRACTFYSAWAGHISKILARLQRPWSAVLIHCHQGVSG